MKRFSLAATAAACILASVLALRSVIAQPETKAFVHITCQAPTAAKYGVPTTVLVKIEIDKGYHVQGNNAKDPYIPTTVEIKTPAGVTIGKITYPPSVRKDFSGEKLPVYENKVEIKVPVTVSEKVKAKHIDLPITVSYQGCNEQSCYPPTKKSISVSLAVDAK